MKLITIGLMFAAAVSAAQPVTDTAFCSVAVANSIASYERFIDGQKLYFNGSLYVTPPMTNDTHPFYLTDDWATGAVVFDGQVFHDVSLLYDVYGDKLVTESTSGNMQLLHSEKVSSFSIHGEKFRNFPDAASLSLPRPGYYQVLYDGPTRVISLRRKIMQEQIDRTKVEITYLERSRYFVFAGGQYSQVKSKRVLLKLLNARRAELRAFIRENRAAFSNSQALAFSSIARHYDVLNRE